MKLHIRLLLLGSGALIALYGFEEMQRGVFVYKNDYSVTNYSAGVIATGAFLSLLSLLPPASVVKKITRLFGIKEKHLPEHSAHHRHHAK